jgi:hypothetical protein
LGSGWTGCNDSLIKKSGIEPAVSKTRKMHADRRQSLAPVIEDIYIWDKEVR